MPVKTGIQDGLNESNQVWIPAYTGMTTPHSVGPSTRKYVRITPP